MFFKPGDIYEAWLYAYRQRIGRAPQGEQFAGAPTWNQLTPVETATYSDMAEQLNKQLEGMILIAAKRIICEENITSGYLSVVERP